MKKFLLTLLAILIVSYCWYRFELRPVDASSVTRIEVTIPTGSSMRKIGQILEEKGVIRSSTAFFVYARSHGAQGKLQAGDFFLRPSMNVQEVIDGLRKGFTEEQSITIPEGYTVSDIDALLASKGLIEAGAFTRCARTCDFSSYDFLPSAAGLAPRGGRLEGYLYPDTYFVSSASFSEKEFAERLLDTFKKRVVVGLATEIKASKRSLPEIITMASLIEEETRTEQERPVVAGILWKRFDQNTGLGVDATVRYIVGKKTEPLTQTDLQIDSPYNLRKYRGLPPGPIANPGLSSIKAALSPEASPYFYYLHGTDGVIRYAVTNDEHNANKQKYLR